MSIVSELNRIKEAKLDIAQSIRDMKVEVEEGSKIDTFPNLIRSISADSFFKRQVIFTATWNKVSSPALTGSGGASGLVVVPGVDNLQGTVTITSIDGSTVLPYNSYIADTPLWSWPEFTDSYGSIFIRIPRIYLKKEDFVDKFIWSASCEEFPGSYLPKCFWDFTNNRPLDYIYVGKYTGTLSSDTSRLETKPNTFPAVNISIINARTKVQANNTGSYRYQLLDIHIVDLLQTLFIIQNSTLNSQSKVAGFTSGRYAATDLATIEESSTNRFITTTAIANNFLVGQSIGIGTSLGGNQIAIYRVITSIDVYDENNRAIVFDGSAVNITTASIIYSMGYKNGVTSILASKYGSITNNTNGKYPFVWQGIENLFGNVWQWIDGININEYQSWVCDDAENYTSNVFASPYKELSYVNHSADGYVKTLGFDPNNPFAQIPIEVGGTTTYYSDYYYRNSGQRAARFGGRWAYGGAAGLFSWHLNSAASAASLDVGARAALKIL